MHLVGFIIRIYHDSRSPERQFITMHGHLNVKISRCTVTWTSIYHDALSPEHQIITMHGRKWKYEQRRLIYTNATAQWCLLASLNTEGRVGEFRRHSVLINYIKLMWISPGWTAQSGDKKQKWQFSSFSIYVSCWLNSLMANFGQGTCRNERQNERVLVLVLVTYWFVLGLNVTSLRI